jgi:hypothetical protein
MRGLRLLLGITRRAYLWATGGAPGGGGPYLLLENSDRVLFEDGGGLLELE